jgi:hypothetical protein
MYTTLSALFSVVKMVKRFNCNFVTFRNTARILSESGCPGFWDFQDFCAVFTLCDNVVKILFAVVTLCSVRF